MAEQTAAAPVGKVHASKDTKREYETIYLLRQDLTPDQVDRIKERLRGIVDREGGRVIKVTTWGRKKTAFLVGDKQARAIYVHVNYLGDGRAVSEVERNLRNIEEVLKFQTIKLSDAVLPESRPTEEDVVLEGDREEERPAREAREGEVREPRAAATPAAPEAEAEGETETKKSEEND
ncbi:MAG TPA: 30S ribosomal protein S6 [Vulgatibacter sp.]|nr:30S ribosomal protein S6 [Vulgatibacter sp.]